MDASQIPVEIDEVYRIVGAKEVLIFKLGQQINEMAAEITRLNEVINNGKLGESNPGNTIRRFPGGVQGEGHRLGNDVPELPNDTPGGVNPVGA